jgi:uncharacterized protein Yka (UPF0111/DUF47 family)
MEAVMDAFAQAEKDNQLLRETLERRGKEPRRVRDIINEIRAFADRKDVVWADGRAVIPVAKEDALALCDAVDRAIEVLGNQIIEDVRRRRELILVAKMGESDAE